MLTRVVVNSARKLPDKQFIVISLMGNGVYGDELVRAGVDLYCLNLHKKNKFSALVELIQIIRRHKPRIIMTWLYHADLLGTIVGLVCGVKRIIWNIRCSDIDFSKYSWTTWFCVKVLAFLSKIPVLVVVNSHAGKQAHINLGYKPKEWRYIPNGFDLDKFKPNEQDRKQMRAELNVADEEPIVGIIARVDPQKDYDTFLQAAVKVSKKNIKAKFLLIGKGTDVLNIPQIIKNQTICLGERKDIPSLLRAIDVFVLSSAYGEGFPNVLGEAMATGVPCVTTDVGDAGRLVGEAGIVVQVGDENELALGIAKYLGRREDLGEKIINPSRVIIQNKYSINKINSMYLIEFSSADL